MDNSTSNETSKGETRGDAPRGFCFILPNGDTSPTIYVAANGCKPLFHISAESVRDLIEGRDALRETVEWHRRVADRERAKVRRLMAALTQELTQAEGGAA
jgi:hypothetical protein